MRFTENRKLRRRNRASEHFKLFCALSEWRTRTVAQVIAVSVMVSVGPVYRRFEVALHFSGKRVCRELGWSPDENILTRASAKT